MITHACGQRSVCAPPEIVYSVSERGRCDADQSSPFWQRMSLTVKCKSSIGPLVVGLSQSTCPAAIRLRVVAIAVDAIERMLRGWSERHVREEYIERRAPLAADLDPSTSIDRVGFYALVLAPKNHMAPSSILRRVRHAVGECACHESAVAAHSFGGSGSAQTSARSNEAKPQMTTAHVFNLSAVAAAHSDAMRGRAGNVEHSQSAEAVADRERGWHTATLSSSGNSNNWRLYAV